jgi:hypothetical protein
MPINVPAITWTEQADPTSPIASYAYSLSAADDISFGLNAERFGIVTRPRFVSVDNTRNTGSVTVRMYNASYTILGSQAQTVPIQAKTDRLQIIGANGTLGVTFFLNEPYAAGVNYSDLLQDTGGATEELFKTTLYVGTGAQRNVTTGVNMLQKGGLQIVKARSAALDNTFYDTERGEFLRLLTGGGAQTVQLQGLTAFNTNGFTVGTQTTENQLNANFVSYSIAEDNTLLRVGSYIGDGTGTRSITHDLGSVPAMVWVKGASGGGVSTDWPVWHKDFPNFFDYALLNNANAVASSMLYFMALPTVDTITIGTDLNVSGTYYVFYVFPDDRSVAGRSVCGFYIGNGSLSGPAISTGKRPMMLMIKGTAAGTWPVMDATRGTGVHHLMNNANSENSTRYVNFNDTGFQVVSADSNVNQFGLRYVYWAVLEP